MPNELQRTFFIIFTILLLLLLNKLAYGQQFGKSEERSQEVVDPVRNALGFWSRFLDRLAQKRFPSDDELHFRINHEQLPNLKFLLPTLVIQSTTLPSTVVPEKPKIVQDNLNITRQPIIDELSANTTTTTTIISTEKSRMIRKKEQKVKNVTLKETTTTSAPSNTNAIGKNASDFNSTTKPAVTTVSLQTLALLEDAIFQLTTPLTTSSTPILDAQTITIGVEDERIVQETSGENSKENNKFQIVKSSMEKPDKETENCIDPLTKNDTFCNKLPNYENIFNLNSTQISEIVSRILKEEFLKELRKINEEFEHENDRMLHIRIRSQEEVLNDQNESSENPKIANGSNSMESLQNTTSKTIIILKFKPEMDETMNSSTLSKAESELQPTSKNSENKLGESKHQEISSTETYNPQKETQDSLSMESTEITKINAVFDANKDSGDEGDHTKSFDVSTQAIYGSTDYLSTKRDNIPEAEEEPTQKATTGVHNLINSFFGFA